MLLASAGAHAAPPADSRWSLGLGLSMGLTLQDTRGTTSTGNIRGPGRDTADILPPFWALELCSPPEPIRSIRCPSNGDALLTAPDVGGEIEVMSPQLLGGWGKPRAFLRVGAGYAFSVKERPSGEGGLEDLVLPPSPAQGGFREYNEISVNGQGSEAYVEYGGLMLTAALGFAFEVDTPWRKIRVRPSFEYLRQKFKGSGKVHRAVKMNSGELIQFPCPGGLGVCNDPIAGDPNPRFLELSASDDLMLNGIGPGLEIDTDAGRFRSVMMSVFAGASAYYFLGDLDFSKTGTNEYLETADFSWEADRWAYRIRAGVRFRWQPD